MADDYEDLQIYAPANLLSERQLAHRWQKSRRTLQRWRSEGFGPAYILIGGSIRYRLADVLDFEDRRRQGGGV